VVCQHSPQPTRRLAKLLKEFRGKVSPGFRAANTHGGCNRGQELQGEEARSEAALGGSFGFAFSGEQRHVVLPWCLVVLIVEKKTKTKKKKEETEETGDFKKDVCI
jgi:hypothetical protein